MCPDKPPLLIALSGNLVRLAEIRGNGAFNRHMSKPTDVDAIVRLLEERFSEADPAP
jgi:hypothetical protein